MNTFYAINLTRRVRHSTQEGWNSVIPNSNNHHIQALQQGTDLSLLLISITAITATQLCACNARNVWFTNYSRSSAAVSHEQHACGSLPQIGTGLLWRKIPNNCYTRHVTRRKRSPWSDLQNGFRPTEFQSQKKNIRLQASVGIKLHNRVRVSRYTTSGFINTGDGSGFQILRAPRCSLLIFMSFRIQIHILSDSVLPSNGQQHMVITEMRYVLSKETRNTFQMWDLRASMSFLLAQKMWSFVAVPGLYHEMEIIFPFPPQ